MALTHLTVQGCKVHEFTTLAQREKALKKIKATKVASTVLKTDTVELVASSRGPYWLIES